MDGGWHGFPDQRKLDVEREKFLKSHGIKTLRFWNSRLRRDAQSIRDAIFNELQARAPHLLPDYIKPIKIAKSQIGRTPALTPTLSRRRGFSRFPLG